MGPPALVGRPRIEAITLQSFLSAARRATQLLVGAPMRTMERGRGHRD